MGRTETPLRSFLGLLVVLGLGACARSTVPRAPAAVGGERKSSSEVGAPAFVPVGAEAKGTTPSSREESPSAPSASLPSAEGECFGVETLAQICSDLAQSGGVEDCALSGTQTFAGGRVFELLVGFNPPPSERTRITRGMNGGKWFEDVRGGNVLLSRRWVLEHEGRFFPLWEGHEMEHSVHELVVTQPAELSESRLLLFREKSRDGDAQVFSATEEISLVSMESPPRVVFHEQVLSKSTTGAGILQEHRSVTALGARALELSASEVKMGSEVYENDPPTHVEYCRGPSCPMACNEAPRRRVGTFVKEPDIKVEVTDRHLVVKSRGGSKLECTNDQTLQAQLVGCVATGAARRVEFAFDASGEFRCGDSIPEYEFINGGFFENDGGKVAPLGSAVAVSLENGRLGEVGLVLDPTAMKMEVRDLRGSELIEISQTLSGDDHYSVKRIEGSERPLGYPSTIIDLTQPGTGCSP